MAANVIVQEANGVGPTWTSGIATFRYCTSDAHTPATTYPIPIPSDASTNYSYWKHHRLYFDTIDTYVENIRWYVDAGGVGWGAGVTVVVGLNSADPHGCPVGNYDQAAGTEGTSGYDMGDAGDGHVYYKDNTPDTSGVNSFVVATPLLVDNTQYTTSTAATYSVVTQVQVTSAATQGSKDAETFTWLYDEV